MAYTRPRISTRPSAVTSSSSSRWEDIPWEDLYSAVTEDQEHALEVYMDEWKEGYKAALRRKEMVWEAMNPESGSCEINFSEELPYRDPSPTTLFNLKRKAAQAACEAFCERHHLKSFGVKYLEQIIGFIAKYTLTTVSGLPYDGRAAELALAEGRKDMLISSRALYKKVFDTPKMLGLYEFLMMDSRSSFLQKQYTAPGRDYCALVPLIPMAFKRHHMVPYSHWETSDLKGVVSKKLYEAMTYEYVLPTTEEIMTSRDLGLTIKTGADSGKKRSAVYTHKLYGETKMNDVPELLQVMLAQIWCAHPMNRTKFMVLSCENWDLIPKPLISTEALIPITSFEEEPFGKAGEDTPW